MRVVLLVGFLLVFSHSEVFADVFGLLSADSVDQIDTTLKTEPVTQTDSNLIDTVPSLLIEPCEDCPVTDSAIIDSSAQSAWASARLEARRQQLTDSLVSSRPISFFDTLTTHFLSERLNQRFWLDESFFHDAGDYFRSHPDYFVIDYQSTPMRKTVQPFGLAGDRMNVLIGDHSVRPFDHTIEPDGLFDFNDFPTSLDEEVYLLPGPAGMIFGGERSVASLLTLPGTPEGTSPETQLRVDKGTFGLSYVRAGVKKSFVGGRRVDFSLGYRRAAGPTYTRFEDAYHYYGDFVFPLKNRYHFRAWGRLYDRDAPLTVRPDSGGSYAYRDRIDRELHLSLARTNENNNQLSRVTLTHLNQASRWFGNFHAGYNISAEGIKLDHQWCMNELLLSAEVMGEYREYRTDAGEHFRKRSGLSFHAIRTEGEYKLSGKVGTEWVEGFRFLPSTAILAMRETDRLLIMASVGYSERAPTLHELYCPTDSASILGMGAYDYSNRGNTGLQSEKELTANLSAEYGSMRSAIRLSLTGGKIFDGINWRPVDLGRRDEFIPSNSDIEFFALSVIHRQALFGHFSLRGGGSYHLQSRDDADPIPYAPEYQAFGGGEFHLYWPQRLLHLFAYGEVVYSSTYQGYADPDLGRIPMVNVKLSFQMRTFRFYWVMKNALDFWDSPRDYHTGVSRFTFYGFEWNFLD